MDAQAFVAAAEDGLLNANWNLLEAWNLNESAWTFNGEFWEEMGWMPVEMCDYVIQLLNRPFFLNHEASHRILDVVEQNWAQMTLTQQERMTAAFKKAYPALTDWRSCHTVSWMLGEYCSETFAFQAFQELVGTQIMRGCNLLPMGIASLAIRTSDKTIAAAACAMLHQLEMHPDPEVRYEVELALYRAREVCDSPPEAITPSQAG